MKRYMFAAPLMLAALSLCSAGEYSEKKPLDHDVYDSWESVSSLRLTDDGNIVAYQVRPQQGDGRLVFRNLESGAELEVERGSGVVIPKDAEVAVFSIKAPYAETRQARIDGKKADEMPRDSVAYVDLRSFELVNLGPAKSFRTGWAASPYIFATLYGDSKDKKDSGDAYGLLMFNTVTGAADTLRNIVDYTVSKSGEKFAAVVEKKVNDSTTVKAVKLYDFASGLSAELSSGKEDYAALSFNDADDMLVFTATDEKEDSVGTPGYAVYLSSLAASG